MSSREGDTLSAIATAYKVKTSALIEANKTAKSLHIENGARSRFIHNRESDTRRRNARYQMTNFNIERNRKIIAFRDSVATMARIRFSHVVDLGSRASLG